MPTPPTKPLWDEAFANPGQSVPLGALVVCDWCSEDWTNRPESGGFIFQSKATCPACATKMLSDIERYREEHFIRARCPDGQSFADFVREFRGPDAALRVSANPRGQMP